MMVSGHLGLGTGPRPFWAQCQKYKQRQPVFHEELEQSPRETRKKDGGERGAFVQTLPRSPVPPEAWLVSVGWFSHISCSHKPPFLVVSQGQHFS